MIEGQWYLFADNDNPGGGTLPTCAPDVGFGTGNRICAKSLDPLEDTTYRLTISSGAGILGLGPQL